MNVIDVIEEIFWTESRLLIHDITPYELHDLDSRNVALNGHVIGYSDNPKESAVYFHGPLGRGGLLT